MSKLLALLMFVCAGTSQANTGILGIDRDNDTYQHTMSALLFADYLTTLDIRRHPEQREAGKWAGSGEFKRSTINTFFFFKASLHYVINELDTFSKYRNIWNLYGVSIHYNAVENNLKLGLEMKF